MVKQFPAAKVADEDNVVPVVWDYAPPVQGGSFQMTPELADE